MSEATSKNGGNAASEQLGADLLELITQRIQTGELVDVEGCLKELPQRAAELQGLLPAIRLMIELGRDAASDDTPPA